MSAVHDAKAWCISTPLVVHTGSQTVHCLPGIQAGLRAATAQINESIAPVDWAPGVRILRLDPIVLLAIIKFPLEG